MLNLFRQQFKIANIVESNGVLSNPKRGMYQIFTVTLGEKTDFDCFINCLVPTESLVLLIVDIGIYRDKQLDEDAISQIEQTICFFAMQKKDVIFRPVYDHEGKGEEKEPDNFEIVKAHMTVIADIVSRCSDKIFVLQGLLVGNWGEMHGSKYLGKGHLRELTSILDERVGRKVFLAVRMPVYYRKIRDGYEQTDSRCVIGLFDDAILASETDMGTFGTLEAVEWGKSWDREKELTFESIICQQGPNGGEAVYGDGFSEKLSSKGVNEVFAKMHMTYLNRQYDRKLLDKWQSRLCMAGGVWKSKSLYEYIEAHLGYRYVIHALKADLSKKYLILNVDIVNKGFASAYENIDLMVYAETDSKIKTYYTGKSVNDIASNVSRQIELKIEVSNNIGARTKIYLGMKNQDEVDIYFGNEKNENNLVYIGELIDYTVDEVKS